MQRRIVPILLCLAALVPRADAHSHDDMAGMPVPQNLGTVSFETSCKPAVREDFDRAVALLHSFWIPVARETFEHVAATDPGCAMAYWGEAMADLHQLFDSPNADDIARGQEALKKADAATETSPRETAYIGALHGFFDDYATVKTPALVCRAHQGLLGCHGDVGGGLSERCRSADLLCAVLAVLGPGR